MAEKFRILIVEDEQPIASDLQRTLERSGYEVVGTAATSDEAIAACERRLPEIVLMDIRIAGPVDGIATAAILLARFGLRVIYLTGDADVAALDRAKQTKPHAYLLKPVRNAELRGAIEIAMATVRDRPG